jgi:hypothetical protein
VLKKYHRERARQSRCCTSWGICILPGTEQELSSSADVYVTYDTWVKAAASNSDRKDSVTIGAHLTIYIAIRG